jgi:soluble P-type ATPase
VYAAGAIDDRQVVRLAASLDQVSPHVLATAVVRAARQRQLDLPLPTQVTEIPGHGIRGTVEGHDVWVGKLPWLGDGLDQQWGRALRKRADRDGRLTIFVRVDDSIVGAFALEDPIRPDAARALRNLRADGFRRLVMVTGDRDDTARSVAAVVGVDEVLSERTPSEKVDAVRFERRNGSTIMVGDGLNDAAALAAADVGVALGARGASAASETADVVVMVDRIDRLGDALRVARRSQRIARESVVAGMGLSLVAMAFAAIGMLPPTGGAFLQEVIDVAVIVNALRALRPGRRQHVTLAEEDLALTRRFRAEHVTLRPDVDHLLAVADKIGTATPAVALDLVRGVHRFLVDDLLPHEQAEDSQLYPALARVLGGTDPTGTMSRGHAEIAHLTHRLGRLLDDLDGDTLDGDDSTDARRLLYGLHAVLRLHFSQEDEGYLSLADDEPSDDRDVGQQRRPTGAALLTPGGIR